MRLQTTIVQSPWFSHHSELSCKVARECFIEEINKFWAYRIIKKETIKHDVEEELIRIEFTLEYI